MCSINRIRSSWARAECTYTRAYYTTRKKTTFILCLSLSLLNNSMVDSSAHVKRQMLSVWGSCEWWRQRQAGREGSCRRPGVASVPSASRILEPGDGGKPAEKQSVEKSTHTWKPRPQYVRAIRVKHSHCRAALYTSWTGLWSKNGLKYTKRNDTHKTT